MADSEKKKIGDYPEQPEKLRDPVSNLIEDENDRAVLKTLVKGQKLFLVATIGPGKSGVRGRLEIRPEWYHRLSRGKAPAHGICTQVICEMIFDGDRLTVGQGFEGVVPQEG